MATSPTTAAAWYDSEAAVHDTQATLLKQRAASLSNARLAAFALLMLAIAWVATTGSRSLAAVIVLATLVAFVALVNAHRRTRERFERERALTILHRRGAARVRRQWDELPLPHDASAPAGHPYARDLDILGARSSLLTLLDVVSRYPGRQTLEAWLLAPANDAQTISDRQASVRELSPRTEFRHELTLAAGRAHSVGAADVERFAEWAASPGWLLDRSGVLWLARITPVLTLLAVALAATGVTPWSVVGAPIVVSIALTAILHERIDRTFAGAMLRATGLRHHAAMLALVEQARFDAPLLAGLRDRLTMRGGASRQLSRLERLLVLGEVRYSTMLHAVLQLLLVWDVHVVAWLEHWQRESGTHVRDWFAALGEVEALGALGTLAHDNPDWTFPTIVNGGAHVVGEAVAHPLLPPDVRVANDVTVGPAGTILIVTGSNMSGKSTLLRAVGMNAVLALAGGPVCARRFELPILDIWTSVRIEDSLAQGLSLFMAELRRLQTIVFAARDRPASRPMLYLLDEILHGTNTAERQIAARTILRHLLRSGAIGAVTTHDLTLAAEPSLQKAAVFVHFSDRFENTAAEARMSFDYVLRPGLATSSNAIRLLELMGLGDTDSVT